MLLIECDLAIYKRLTGYPLDAKGRPQVDQTGRPINREVIGPPGLNPSDTIWDPINKVLIPNLPLLPSYGIRVPTAIAPSRNERGLTSLDPAALPQRLQDRFNTNSFMQIPVFDINVTGRKYEDFWPCVTFGWGDLTPDPSTYMYYSDFGAKGSVSHQDPTSAPITIRNRNGLALASGFQNNVSRPEPEGWSVFYEITARSKNSTEHKLICGEIMKLFPAKGAINITLMDGTVCSRDMLLQDIERDDPFGDAVLMTQGGEQQREFVRKYVYLIETYLDNASNQFGIQDSYWATRNQHPVLQRIFEIEDAVTGAIEDRAHDVNLDVLTPFTPGGDGQ